MALLVVERHNRVDVRRAESVNRDETLAAVLDVLQRAPMHVDLVGMLSRGVSNRVEVTVAIESQDQNRRLLLNVTRHDRVALKAELRRKLDDELHERLA